MLFQSTYCTYVRLARGGYAENLSIGRDPRTNRDPGRPRHPWRRSCARVRIPACRGQSGQLGAGPASPDRSDRLVQDSRSDFVACPRAIWSRVTRSPRGRWSPRPGCCEEVGGPPFWVRARLPAVLFLGLELDWEVGIIGIGTSRPRVSDGIGGGLRSAPVVVPIVPSSHQPVSYAFTVSIPS